MGGKKEDERIDKSQGKPRASVIGGAGDSRGLSCGAYRPIRNLGYFSSTLCILCLGRQVIVRLFPVFSTLLYMLVPALIR